MKTTFAIISLACLIVCGCVKDGLEDRPIDFQVSSLDITSIERDGRIMCINIGCASNTLVFEAIGVNKSNGFISSVRTSSMNDYYYRDTYLTDRLPFTFYNNEEITIHVLSTNPHITKIELKEHINTGKKQHVVEFGQASYRTTIIINQEGNNP